MKKIHFPICLLGAALLAGCNSTPTMYQWNDYQWQVYEYFKGESTEKQLSALEAGLQKMQAAGKLPPPGYFAQMGMLYGSQGKNEQMLSAFRSEKEAFPESTAYMDFLTRNFKKPDAKNAK